MSILSCTRSIPKRFFSQSASLSRTLTALPESITPTPEPPAPSAKKQETLHGTAPYAELYIILHTHEPPGEYPTRKVTPLQRKLQLELVKHQIRGTVNFAHRPDLVHLASKPDEAGAEHYFVTVYSERGQGMRDIPLLSMDNFEFIAQDLITGPVPLETHQNDEVRLYVCTHGARDCRCGDIGGTFVQALREEVIKRKLEDTVKVGEIGHVGGHKWAGNMLVFPHGEWLGQLKPENAPKVLEEIINAPRKPLRFTGKPICREHWRGRLGLDKVEQLNLLL